MTALSRKHRFDEVFDAQKVYRLVLTAISNPGRAVEICYYAGKLFGDFPGMLALAFTLLDNEVSFAVCGSEALAADIACLTGAPKAEPGCADYLFVTDPSLLEAAVTNAKCGTLRDPHRSATLVVNAAGPAVHPLALSGPGIAGITGFSAAARYTRPGTAGRPGV
jgi:alpha-D-ribose 1-methylphosphonate 5-triphosphate synthase subunit PhnH